MTTSRLARYGTLVLGACAGAFVGLLIHSSTQWIGSTFPGFFVLQNRVVPSISLPDWGDRTDLFQSRIIAVDQMPVETSAEVYRIVASEPPGTMFEYRVRREGGSEFSRAISSRLFSYADYFFLFGAILFSGIAFLLAGLSVFGLKPHLSASLGLLSAGVWAGLFALTALDLYWPHTWFRLHALAECLLPAGFIHLALVFPTDRVPRWRKLAFAALYCPFLTLAATYQLYLFDPIVYPIVHLVAVGAGGVSGLPLVMVIGYDLVSSPSVLVRRRLGVVALGAVGGFIMPIFLWVGSSVLGGTVPVNAAGLTAFLFPLALAYGIVKQDLFEIDVMLRRTMVYGSLVLVISGVYFGVLFGVGIMMPGTRASAWSPIALAVLNFGLLFMLAPLRDRLQQAIDRVFFRKAYDIETSLSRLSGALASPHTIEGVLQQFREACDLTVCPERASIHLQAKPRALAGEPCDSDLQGLDIPDAAVARLEKGELLTVYDAEDGDEAVRSLWQRLAAEILVPLRNRERLIGVAVFGPRRSGHLYSAHDLNFLKAALNQVALALATADAFGQLDASNRNLERLNESLEEQVRERTAALKASNMELNDSLSRLQEAYGQLEQSQASLLRADRLATLGQLTAGIAHEMNTPLSAVLNALRIIGELGEEYRDSIDDGQVLPEDHLAIAQEIITNAEAAGRWTAKAAGYIRSVKAHGREYQPGNSIRFSVKAVVDETHALLAHRMRSSGCSIEADAETERTMVNGDPGILNQIILNLVTNAIDAYEDSNKPSGCIAIGASYETGAVRIDVRDGAGGVPADVLPHIFDELFTTKGPGRGTGLGLWITRNLVEQRFGGTLEVETQPGVGSCFTLRLPIEIEADKQPPTSTELHGSSAA